MSAATVQYIVKEMQNIHNLNIDIALCWLVKAVPADSLAAVSCAFAQNAFFNYRFLFHLPIGDTSITETAFVLCHRQR